MKSSKKAFTLVELIAVTAIIGFLAYTSIPYGESMYSNIAEERAINSIEKVRDALDRYYKDHGYYPLIPSFTPTDPENERFTALQTLERELTGKEIPGYPEDQYQTTNKQRVYLTELPVNPYTDSKADWEIRDSYLPAWHPVNEAMNPHVDPSGAGYGVAGGLGSTGTFSGLADSSDMVKISDIANDIGYPVRVQKNSYDAEGSRIVSSAGSLASTITDMKNNSIIDTLVYIEKAYMQATGAYYNTHNSQKTRDIYDIRFPQWLNKKARKGTNDKDLSEF